MDFFSLSNRKGFTLIEVLVALAIILVLAALTVTGLGRARQAARQANALGPIQKVAAGNASFAMENNGRINTLRWKGDPEEGRPYVGNSFWGRMEPHLFTDIEGRTQQDLKDDILARLSSLLVTENAKTMSGTLIEGSKIYHDSSGLPVPFAFNRHLYTWKEWETMNQVNGASEIAYITYGFGVFDEEDGRTYVERPTDGSKPENNIYYLPSGKAMVGFLDGHIELLSPPFSDRRFKSSQ